MGKARIIKDFFVFLKEMRKLWLIPIIVVLLVLSIIIILGEATALGPFIYTLF